MRPLGYAAALFGHVLLVFGLASVAMDASRRRDRARLDIIAVFILLLIPRFLGWLPTLVAAQLLPIALLRLIRQFRPVPRTWILWTLLIAAVTPVASLFLQEPLTRTVGRVTVLYSAVAMAVVAYLLFVEARRSVGVKATRIFLASAGSGLLGSSFALASIGGWFASFAVSSTPIIGIVQGIALICYYIAFATPRFLLTRWRRAEQAKYLRNRQ